MDDKTIVLGELPMPKESVPKAVHHALVALGCHFTSRHGRKRMVCPVDISIVIDMGDPTDGRARITLDIPAV